MPSVCGASGKASFAGTPRRSTMAPALAGSYTSRGNPFGFFLFFLAISVPSKPSGGGGGSGRREKKLRCEVLPGAGGGYCGHGGGQMAGAVEDGARQRLWPWRAGGGGDGNHGSGLSVTS